MFLRASAIDSSALSSPEIATMTEPATVGHASAWLHLYGSTFANKKGVTEREHDRRFLLGPSHRLRARLGSGIHHLDRSRGDARADARRGNFFLHSRPLGR